MARTGCSVVAPEGRVALWDSKFALPSARGYAMEGRLYPNSEASLFQ